ncbi:MAG TPA: hypothetical protein VKK79_18190 [Candidatus Lokiarchaeia archaeon]|nr:hypothetical protein [Candidatus Lokiarchaeia archaeon]
MRLKVVALIALLAGITLLALGLSENQWSQLPNLFTAMKAVSPIYKLI